MAAEACTRYPYLGCSLPKRNETCYNPAYRCMADVIGENDPGGRLETDAREQGYSFIGPEDYISLLNQGSARVVRSDGREAPFSYFIRENHLSPFLTGLDHTQLVDAIEYHHARGSEFSGSKCPLSVLYSNIDKDKAEAATGRKAKDLMSATAGTLRHETISSPGTMHEQAFGIPRSAYTEKRVAYRFPVSGIEDDLDSLFAFMAGGDLDVALWDKPNFDVERRYYSGFFQDLDWRESGLESYVIKGSADCLLRLGNDLAIMDWKRSRYFKNSFGLQMTAYSLAVEQMLGADFNSYFLIAVINNYSNQPYEYRKPHPHIIQVQKDDIMIKTLKLKTVFLHTIVSELVRNPRLFLEMRDHQRELEQTKFKDEPCSRCQVLYSGTPCANLENDLCDILYDFVKQGGNLESLLIDGFQV